MWPAIFVICLLVLGVIMLLIRRRTGYDLRLHRPRRHINMQAAWDSCLSNRGAGSIHDSAAPGLLDVLGEDVRESVHKSLLEFEAGLLVESKPMLAVRRELMDSIDRRQLNSELLKLSADIRANLRSRHPEILQNDAAAHTYILANELRIAVLREYADLRFGDRADGDWFDVYQKASRLRQHSTRNYIERTFGGTHTATDDARFHTMTLMEGEIRTRLLQVPAGTRFPGFGKQIENSSEPA